MSSSRTNARPRHSIGFGIEKLAYASTAHPRIFWALIGLITILAFLILPSIRFDSNIIRMYQGSGSQYDTFADVRNKFGMFETDLFIFVDAADLSDPAAFEAERALAEELALTDNVAAVLSPFSLRLPNPDGGTVAALPLDLTTKEQISAAFDDLLATLPLASNLISEDHTQMKMVVMPRVTDDASSDKALDAVQETVNFMADPSINITIGGQLVWMRNLLALAGQDQLMLNVSGLVIAVVLALVIFRHPVLALVVSISPAIIAVWTMAATLYLFGAVTFFTMVLATLMMMFGFAESVYFVSMWQRAKRRGLTGLEAVRDTIREVCPATVLSMLTTTAAFVSLIPAPGKGIKEFAYGGAVGTVLGLFALLTILPLLLMAADRFLPASMFRPEASESKLEKWYANLVRRFARPVALFAVVITVLMLAPYAHIKANFSILDLVPKQLLNIQPTIDGTDSTGVGGIAPVYMAVRLDDDGSSVSLADLERIKTVSTIMQDAVGAGRVLSLAEFADFGSPEQTDGILEAIGPDLANRFITRDGKEAMLTAFADPNATGEQLKARLVDLSQRVAAEGIEASLPTGFRVLTTYESEHLIDQMEFSLFTAIFLAIGMIGLAFSEWRIIALATIPNLFPLLAAVSYLYFSGTGQTMTSVMVLTIAFGVAVNDTIHFLAAYRHHRENRPRLAAISAAVRQVGKSMIVTTSILCTGVLATLFSVMPQVQTFGAIFIGAMVFALIGDLVFLPAIIAASKRD
ncbi:MAG: MMPL family transporter [Hyphomicrobiaceae bacterium]|nr:MMPL family transporter [Hyphomicrobiaceae bacterium]